MTTIFEVTFSVIALGEGVGVGEREDWGEGETRGMGVARLGVAV
jgi:hypothetical protein